MEYSYTNSVAARTNVISLCRLVAAVAWLAMASQGQAAPSSAEENDSQPMSRTGPVPPPEVKAPEVSILAANVAILNVPSYIWHHGCGPTAVGMVVGYWDQYGYDDLVPGNADQQTADVNQTIASGGTAGAPQPAGSEQHYEDYASPEEIIHTNILDDAYITAGRAAHANDSIADYLLTSRSTINLPYGWSRGGDIAPGFEDFIDDFGAKYHGDSTLHKFSVSLDWDLLCDEIDSQCPMVFLVDSRGNGQTDHLVTVVGYREVAGAKEYGCYDTWNHVLRWERFRAMSATYSWGVYCGYTIGVRHDDVHWVDFDYGDASNGDFTQPYHTLDAARGAAGSGDAIWIKAGSSSETLVLDTPMTLHAFKGNVVIGD